MNKFKIFLLSILSLSMFVACGDDDDDNNNSGDPVASFRFEVDENDPLTVAFNSFSTDATSFAWDFGDGNSSTEENPTHTYEAYGDYSVTLTASNGDKSASQTQDISLKDPDAAGALLHGGSSKVWKLTRYVDAEEYPLVVGPADRTSIWWAFGRDAEIGTRPCLMEEEYIFHADGTYEYKTDGTVFADAGIWAEDYNEQCVDENNSEQMTGINGDDLSAWGSGTFTYNYDITNKTLQVEGLGAHVGLAKVGSTSEVFVPQSEVVYNVVSLTNEGNVDKMVLETSLVDAGGYWQFNLVSYQDPNDEPDLPGASPSVSFEFEVNESTVSFNNKSVNADSYSWDFGDGSTSTEENPTHTYTADGSYVVKLTATNENGESSTEANVVISTESVFSAAVLHGNGTKEWKLKPVAAALAVGPAKGSGEWWANSADDVDLRACLFNDVFSFSDDGTFSYNSNGDIWAEGYMGVAMDGCIAEGDMPADAAAWGSGDHSFAVGTDDPATLSVTGTGAFIGLPKVFNGGEYAAAPPRMDETVTYEVLSYLKEGGSETLVLTIDISDNGGAFWTFTLESN